MDNLIGSGVFIQRVPKADSADNAFPGDVIGNKNDEHTGDSLYSKTYILDSHIHKGIFTRPNLANGITLIKAAGAWAAYPAPTEIIAASDIARDFDFHWMSISGISANGEYQIQLYTGASGSEIALGEGFTASRSAVQSQEGTRPIQSVIIPAGTRISAALSSSNSAADTIKIKLEGHTY